MCANTQSNMYQISEILNFNIFLLKIKTDFFKSQLLKFLKILIITFHFCENCPSVPYFLKDIN